MKLLKVFFVFLIIVSCKDEQELIEPECLLSEAEMINLMIDISLLKSAKSVGRKGLKDSGIKPLEYLFVKHGVDTITIRENVEYYSADLKKSEELYNKITDTLLIRQERLETYVDFLDNDKEENEEEIDSLSSSEKNKKGKLLEKETDLKDETEENESLEDEEEIDSLSSSNKNDEKSSSSVKEFNSNKNQEDKFSDKGEGEDEVVKED